MKIAYTRAMVRAALDGRLDGSELRQDDNFGLLVPAACPDVLTTVLDLRTAWQDKGAMT